MSLDPLVAPEYASLEDTDEALAAMMSRLRAIIDKPSLSEDKFVEISSIYNNVAYIFLYLESNEAHVNYDRVLPWRDAFYKDAELDARILELLLGLRCSDSEAEEARLAFVTHFRDQAETPDRSTDETLKQLLDAAKAVLGDIQRDELELLRRLGGNAGSARSAAAFYKLISGTESAETRTKLSRVRTQMRDRRLSKLIGIVDQMVDVRRRQTEARGFESVLAATLKRCRISQETARTYLESFLVHALESHASLEAEVLEAAGARDNAMDHFGYYVRGLQAGRTVPQFALNECLKFILQVLNRAFGLTLTEVPNRSPHVIALDVEVDGHPAGQINFDLWDTRARARTANQTRGIRNRTDWAGLVQRPVAYVSCRFQRMDDGSNRVTFQNVHSLFHEFGHAVNHLLIRKRLPSHSGLEYLPLERLETLSMWFEKWVYHPQFVDNLPLSRNERDGLALCQRVKMLEYRRTHVERAVTAALDFELHRRPNGGLEDSFQRLHEQFGVARYCTLGDFPGYFTWPMFQVNPGANFAYLWGAAASASEFAPFMEQRLEDIRSPAEVRARFSSCFNFDEPSVAPDSRAVFAFYDQPFQSRASADRT